MSGLQGAYALLSPVASTDTTLATAVRDPLLSGVANNGVRYIADLGFGFSYPGGPFTGRPAPGAPANGASIFDVAELADSSFVLAAGQAVSYAGGGFDFSALTANRSYLQVPASVAGDIWTPFGGVAQQFLVCGYFKFPAQADWNTLATFAPFLSWANSNAAAGAADLVSVGQATGNALFAGRQTGGSTLASVSIPMPAGAFGQFAQVAYWRNAAGSGLSLKTVATGRTSNVLAVGADNVENFSARDGRFGVGSAYWGATLTGQPGAVKFRMYRAFVENLARSGRDPLTVLDADFDRVIARAAFS